MATWEFENVPANFVQQNPTQRDQFNNDEVDLAEALVREVIQNSTDADDEVGPVKVCFTVREFDASETSELRKYCEPLKPHLLQCGVSADAIDAPTARVLVVEDFGTFGLTGDPATTDPSHFCNFWRVHGGSGKGGASGGRWGLGKLVYSSSSEIRAFFGMTVREGDEGPLLMGQAVLKNHRIGTKSHPAHGFWFEERGPDQIQLPVTSAATISAFRSLMKPARDKEPGLSVFVPYLRANIDEQAIIDAVLRNYYFPILAGRLSVEVGSVSIDQRTFHKVAESRPKGKSGISIALDFVEAVSSQLEAAPEFTASSPLNLKGVNEAMFTPEEQEAMKATFRAGKLLHVRVPVNLRKISGVGVSSHIDLYLRALPEGSNPFALYARGSITVPGETRFFAGIQAYGAMVAADKGVTDFLGDAENPAHTNWIASAEKLAERWKSPADAVKRIRYALADLYSIVGEQVEHEDRNALLDLFSLVDAARSPGGAKKRNKKPKVKIEPREKALSIRGRKGGFEVIAGPGATKWKFPKKIRIRVAYDTMIGNPFTAHSRFDFDLTKGEIEIEAKDAAVEPYKPNIIVATVTGPEFAISGTGFGDTRDIVVDARAA